MIIKKPYAFMIKHFRIIHLVLLLPMLYLITQTKQIIEFFRTYVANGYLLSSSNVLQSLSSDYINIFMYLAIIILIGSFITISILLQQKEKPTKFYNITIVYYIAIFILLTASFSVFKAIEDDTIANTFVNIIRDLATIVHYSQYIFVIFTAIRGIGFNIKKFNFKSDLDELEISSEDSEEVEFLIGGDTYKLKRTIRRFFRELSYYYKENKFIFTVIIVVIILIIGNIIYTNRTIYQRVYRENESLAFGNLNIRITDSYISNLSQNGKVIKDGKYYVIIKIDITNRYEENLQLSYSNLALVGDRVYETPDITAGNYFVDYGDPYRDAYIKGNDTSSYVIAYEIDASDIRKNFHLEAYSGYGNTNKININPTLINDNIRTTFINEGMNISLSNTNLGQSEFAIIDYELTDFFSYNYENCLTENNCLLSTDYIRPDTNLNTLLVLDYNLVLDSSSLYLSSPKTYRSFFRDFVEIEYSIDDKDYTAIANLLNPSSYTDKAVLAVPRTINNADTINIVVTIRNVAYSIKLL